MNLKQNNIPKIITKIKWQEKKNASTRCRTSFQYSLNIFLYAWKNLPGERANWWNWSSGGYEPCSTPAAVRRGRNWWSRMKRSACPFRSAGVFWWGSIVLWGWRWWRGSPPATSPRSVSASLFQSRPKLPVWASRPDRAGCALRGCRRRTPSPATSPPLRARPQSCRTQSSRRCTGPSLVMKNPLREDCPTKDLVILSWTRLDWLPRPGRTSVSGASASDRRRSSWARCWDLVWWAFRWHLFWLSPPVYLQGNLTVGLSMMASSVLSLFWWWSSAGFAAGSPPSALIRGVRKNQPGAPPALPWAPLRPNPSAEKSHMKWGARKTKKKSTIVYDVRCAEYSLKMSPWLMLLSWRETGRPFNTFDWTDADKKHWALRGRTNNSHTRIDFVIFFRVYRPLRGFNSRGKS